MVLCLWRTLLFLHCLAFENFYNKRTVLSQYTEQVLLNTLLKNYNKDVGPREKVTGDILMFIRQIVALDENNQLMTSSVYFSEKWIDQRLAWDPNDYGGLVFLNVPVKMIWIPDLMVINTADTNGFLKVNDFDSATVYYNGSIYMLLSTISLKTRCKMDSRKFPFDTQSCPLTLSSWAKTVDKINFDTTTKNIDNNSYILNSVWELTNVSLNVTYNYNRHPSEPSPVEELTFIFTLRRWPLYYMITGIFPSIILNIVTLVSYALPFAQQISLSKK